MTTKAVLDLTPVDRYRSLLHCYAGMVGTLYPQIAYRELVDLWHEHEVIKQRWAFPPQPRWDGSVPHVNTAEKGPPEILF